MPDTLRCSGSRVDPLTLGRASQRQPWPGSISRRPVSTEFIERASQWRVINFAHAIAAEGIPAGVVLREDQEAVGTILPPVEQLALLGPALDAFAARQTDYEVLVAGKGLVFRPRGGACNPSLDRPVTTFDDRGPLHEVIQRLVLKGSGQPPPIVPPEIVASMRGDPRVANESNLWTRLVEVESKASTVAGILNDLVAQVPGVVWGVRERWRASPPCNLTIFTANHALITSDDLR